MAIGNAPNPYMAAEHDPLCPESTLTHTCLNCGSLTSADATECPEPICRVSSCCNAGIVEPECDEDGWHGPWAEPAGCMCDELAESRAIEAAEQAAMYAEDYREQYR